MLEVDEISMAYGPIGVVHDLSLQVPDGQIVSVLGRNGAGKTTTLNGIAGVLRPISGDVRLNGASIVKRQINAISRMGVAYVPEGRGVFPSLTVWENLAASAYGHGLRGRAATTEIKRALALMPALETRVKQRAGTMSGGEQQMLVLARALLSRPQLLLVDEPGLGLSPLLVSQVYEHLVRFNRDDGLSILLVEQYVDLAINTAQHAYVLEKGRLAFQGPCAELKKSKALVTAYVG